MRTLLFSQWRKWRWDGLGIGLAGLCLAHCLATTILLAFTASLGGFFVQPIIHETGLAIAIFLGLIALGRGFWDHRKALPIAVGSIGLSIMAGALMLPHGTVEIGITIVGTLILTVGHILNLRALSPAS